MSYLTYDVYIKTGSGSKTLNIHKCGGVITREPMLHYNPDGTIHSFTGIVQELCIKCGHFDVYAWNE